MWRNLIWIFSWMCLSHTTLNAQNEVLIPIVNHKVFNLDSRGSTFFSGQHLTALELDLPVNTVRWYYRFYNVTKKEYLSKYSLGISLIDELELRKKSTGFTSIKLPAIPNDFKNKVSVYLLNDSSEVSVFNKQLTFTKVKFHPQFSMMNVTSGWMEVCDPAFISGKQYIGLLNQGNLSGTNIVLDVVAFCKQRTVEGDWSEEVLKSIEINFVDSITSKLSPFVIQKVSDCYVKSLQYATSYSDYTRLSSTNKKNLEQDILEKCYNENFQVVEPDTLKELDVYYIIGSWQTEKGELLEMKFSNEISLSKKNGTVLKGNWYIDDNTLFLKFENFPIQKYQPVVLSPQKYVWKNNQTGNYLRYSRAKS